ncbi:MAG: tetratricopeptide repeat protein [Thermoplasmata archaeon]|nr:tetratricopeptide repeat protein [Thermoplasmata archaeon]
MNQRADLGVHYLLRGEYDRAVRAFLDVIRDDPADATAWSYYGISLAHTGRPVEAEAALARAIQLSPTNGESWFHLGVARSLREEWGEAASAYRKAVALAPEDMVAWHRLGVALAESGEEPSASAAFERALVLSRSLPTDELVAPARPRFDDHVDEAGAREGAREAKSWLDLSLSLLSLGDEDAAVAAYERAYTLDPTRAQNSLFRPMLRLLTAVEGGADPGEEEFPVPARPRPRSDVGRPEVR